jgi:hypothetical protein
MDEFFGPDEHLALVEPMVIECAQSAPVVETPVIRVRIPVRRLRAFTQVLVATLRTLIPQPTAPPVLV